ncbi:MAG: hypothetical protein QXW97_02400 [Candidatus Pacearchaeota archaeon]
MIETLETRSANEFKNPFYIIVHSQTPFNDKYLRKKGSIRKVLTEIVNIKRKYDFASIDDLTPEDTILPEIPKNRTILVCGFFRDICVKTQVICLKKRGYNAYISKEGTYPAKDYLNFKSH